MLIWYRGHFLASLVSIIGCISSIYGAFLMMNTPADEDYTKGVILIVVGLVIVLAGYIIKASEDRGDPSAVKIFTLSVLIVSLIFVPGSMIESMEDS